jgi:serine/threonine protein kinase
MGEVYRAHDARLDRHVAIKLVPAALAADPLAVERFRREARAIAALNHPNICTIHDIGEVTDGPLAGRPFLVMEVIDGRALGELLGGPPLFFEQIVTLAIDLADALEAAHAKGIVHRDIKPGNVFVTSRGRAKMLDFGLAKTVEAMAPPPIDRIAASRTTVVGDELTERGLVVGTVSYMSPEQALGENVDARSDLFSLGVVLYEMATGQLPFRGKTAAAVFNALINLDPEPASRINGMLPSSLESVIAKCLEKDPESRYQSAAELQADLRRLMRDASPGPIESASAVSGYAERARTKRPASDVRGAARPSSSGAIDSVVVLPFDNESGNPDNEYLSNGITDGIINSLSKLGHVRVVPRSLAFSYKGKGDDPLAIAHALRVRAIVTGRVTRHADTLMVGAEMMDVDTVSQTWGDQYARDVAQIFALQDDVVRDIVRNLRVKLAGEEESRLTGKATTDTEAYELYLRGKFEFDKHLPEGFRAAIAYFEQAINRDPAFVMAYVELARAYMFLVAMLAMPVHEGYAKASLFARQALALDDNSGGAHFVLGSVRWFGDWNGPEAEREFRRGLALDPQFESMAYDWWLSAHGRHDEAVAEARRVVALNPTAVSNVATLISILGTAGRFDEAVAEAEKLHALHPHSPASQRALGLAYLLVNRVADAERLLASARDSGTATQQSLLAVAYARLGREHDATRILEALQALADQRRSAPVDTARVLVALDRRDEAFTWLDRAVTVRDGWVLNLKNDPFFNALAADPRWAELQMRIKAAGRIE